MSEPIKLYFDFQKSNSFAKDFKVDGIDIDSNIPAIFKDIPLDNGVYIWGYASNEDLDRQGERIKYASDEVPKMLETAPHNKLMLEHDKTGANTGMAPVGKIVFSRKVPEMGNQHILLSKVNNHHPLYPNILGSVKDGFIDSFSVSGNASRDHQYNSQTQKNEIIRTVHNLTETSLTSSPANEGAGIVDMFIVKNMGSSEFFKSLKGYGGVEIPFKEENKMDTKDFVPVADFNALKSDVGNINKKLDTFLKSQEGFMEELKKAVSEDSEDDNITKKTNDNSEKDSVEKMVNDKVEKKLEEIKKSMHATSNASHKDGRGDAGFDNIRRLQEDTPLFNIVRGSFNMAPIKGGQ